MRDRLTQLREGLKRALDRQAIFQKSLREATDEVARFKAEIEKEEARQKELSSTPYFRGVGNCLYVKTEDGRYVLVKSAHGGGIGWLCVAPEVTPITAEEFFSAE